jgi:hypothetical protein
VLNVLFYGALLIRHYMTTLTGYFSLEHNKPSKISS